MRGSRSPALLLVCSVFLAAAALVPERAESQVEPANVLLVVTDDQRATNTLWTMPKTRAVLAPGTKYSNAFATTPLCCPSRATILTGRYAHNTGVTSQNPRPLDLATLFPRLLQEGGYQTGMVGKFLNGWGLDNAPPYFDRWATICSCNSVPLAFNVDGTRTTLFGHSTKLLSDYAAQFLRAFEDDDAAPWFLYVAPTSPHWPWTPARKYADARFPKWHGNPAVLEKNRADKPPFVRELHFGLAGARKVRTGQLRELRSVDDMVGRLTALLDRLGEASNTLLMYTADNGFLWADHGIGGDGRTAGEKRLPYTASTRVPLLVRWPGRAPSSSIEDRLVGTLDIAPTILEAAGIRPDPASPPLDGRSLLEPTRRDRLLLEYWHERSFPSWASIRTETYQYTEYYAEDETTTTFREYYDLVADPWQLVNLLHDGDPGNNPDVSAIRAQLAQDRACVGTGSSLACP